MEVAVVFVCLRQKVHAALLFHSEHKTRSKQFIYPNRLWARAKEPKLLAASAPRAP